jgi:hypothetical protein
MSTSRFDVRELLLVNLEVGSLGVFSLEGVAQRLLIGRNLVENGLLIAPHHEVEKDSRENHEAQHHRAGANRQRPAARIVRVQ